MDPLFWFLAILAMFEALKINHDHQTISFYKRIAAEPAIHPPMQSIAPLAAATENREVHFKGTAPDTLADMSISARETYNQGPPADYTKGQVAGTVLICTAILAATVVSVLVYFNGGDLDIFGLDVDFGKQALGEGDSNNEALAKKNEISYNEESKKIANLTTANATLTKDNASLRNENANLMKEKETLTKTNESLTLDNGIMTDSMEALIIAQLMTVRDNKTLFGKYTTLYHQYSGLADETARSQEKLYQKKEEIKNYLRTIQEQEGEHERTCSVYLDMLSERDKRIAELENVAQTPGNAGDPDFEEALRRKDEQIVELVAQQKREANDLKEDLQQKEREFAQLKHGYSELRDDAKDLEKALQVRDDRISALTDKLRLYIQEFGKLAIRHVQCKERLRHKTQANETRLYASRLMRAMLLSLEAGELSNSPSQDGDDDDDTSPPPDPDDPPAKSRDDGGNDGEERREHPDEANGDDDDVEPTCSSSPPNSSDARYPPSNEPTAESPSNRGPIGPNTSDATSDTTSTTEKSRTNDAPANSTSTMSRSMIHAELRRKGAPRGPKATRIKGENTPGPLGRVDPIPQIRPTQTPAPGDRKPDISVEPDLAKMFRSRILKAGPGKR